jgi:hypothetical protein
MVNELGKRKELFYCGNRSNLSRSFKAYRVLGLQSFRSQKINYFQYRVAIPLTIGPHAHSVIADLGFFSSPEQDGSYLNRPRLHQPEDV